MLRRATAADLPAIAALRAEPGPDPLSDPARLDDAAAARIVAEGGQWVWEEGGALLGCAAADRRAGEILALLVASGHDGRGIGRALLAAARGDLAAAGHAAARIALPTGSAAEHHYRRGGWREIGRTADGGAIFATPVAAGPTIEKP